MKESLVKVGEFIVAEDKEEGSSLIKIIPLASGTRISGSWLLENKVKLPSGKEIDASDTLEAIWLSTNSNRRTPPDVTAGSTVTAYKDPRGNTYYWTEEQTQLNYRKKEEVTYAYANRPEGKDSPEDQPLELCTYNITISTLNKLIRLNTAKNDEEQAKYVFNLDTKEGIFTYYDDLGNMKILKSVDGVETTIRKTLIATNAPNIMELADKSVTLYNMGEETKLYDKDVTHEITGNYNVKAKESTLDIATLKQHITKLDAKIGEFTIAVEKALSVNSLKVKKTSVSVEPLEVDKYNETKDNVLKHFQEVLDNAKDPNKEEEDEEKREKVDSEKNDAVNEGQTEFEVEVDNPIKIISKLTLEIKGMTKSLGGILTDIATILNQMNTTLMADGAVPSAPGKPTLSAYPGIGGNLTSSITQLTTDISTNFK